MKKDFTNVYEGSSDSVPSTTRFVGELEEWRFRLPQVYTVGEGVALRYLVRSRVRPDKAESLLRAVADGTLGRGSVAEGEYLRCLGEARRLKDGSVRWVEVCYCAVPLEEERPYWEEFFELERVQDAHSRRRCRDHNGEQSWACSDCDCTRRLEERLKCLGEPFLPTLAPGSGSRSE